MILTFIRHRMSLERPIRVFTEIKNTRRGHFKTKTDSLPFYQDHIEAPLDEFGTMNINADDKQISVTGVGELVLPPDRYSITVRCRSSKDNLQDAKNSVKKRIDYILQTLKNNSLKDDDIMVYQHTSHLESKVNIDCEVESHFTDLTRCQAVSNLLAEKLGPAISVSLPRCYHAKGSIDKLRKQAGMLAIHNARQKAKEMARVVHLSVGHAVKVEEIESTETQGADEKHDEDFDLNPSIQQRVAEASVSIVNRVNVCFLLKASKKK